MSYKIIILPPAIKFLKNIETKFASKIKERIDLLAIEPRHNGSIKLSGEKNSYRTRVGTFRIVYEIHDEKVLVMVIRINHRKDVYRS